MSVFSANNLPDQKQKLFLLGVGQTAVNVAKLALNYQLYGTTRDKNKIQFLQSHSIHPILLDPNFSIEQQTELPNFLVNAKILVSFPPDGKSDKLFAGLCSTSNTVIYISSTSVYGNHQGIVTETTNVDRETQSTKLRLEAEKYWLDKGAIVLRAPGLYWSNSGLHLRLLNGTYRLPEKGNNYISRIHLQDLARIILAAFAKPLDSGSIYLVGDLNPAPQKEVAEWLCQQMNIPLPPIAAPDTVSRFLTSNRRIDATKILNQLNIELQFPTYKEGYTECLQAFKDGNINLQAPC